MVTVESSVSHFHTTTAGSKLHFLQSGKPEGTLLLCLHGLGGSIETFLPLISSLSHSCNIVLAVFQGFGKSPLTESRNTMSIANHVADIADLVEALLERSNILQPRGVVMLGHYLRATIALQYAAQHPRNIRGLALIRPGRSAAHILAVRRRMLDLAASVRSEGIVFAAELAAILNFYEDI